MFKELKDDLGCPPPAPGGDCSLVKWARQGVLLLNTALTVRAGEPLSHRGKGWERFTDAVIRAVNGKPEPVVFALWGGQAQKKLPLIDATRHAVVQSAHPSPLSARAGFFGSRPFSRINEALRAMGKPPIDWRLCD
jgi:uracil-DNA glycosylase